MTTKEMRQQLAELARSQMSAEQLNQSLLKLVEEMQRIESAQTAELNRLRRHIGLHGRLFVGVMALVVLLCAVAPWVYWQSGDQHATLTQLERQLLLQRKNLATITDEISELRSARALHEKGLIQALRWMQAQQKVTLDQPVTP